jgi:hypothetical protein
MIVEINPADVVSIPTDCQFQKLRTCKYKVVGEYEIDLTDPMYASRFQTDDDDDVDVWNDANWDSCDECECCPMECNECLCCNDCCGCNSDKLPTCSDCGEESYGNCEDCDCCEGCCDCSDDEEDKPEQKVEVQLTLNLDNKMQSVDWKKQTVNLIKLVGHLFSSRRPALAMSIRREFDNYDDTTRIAFEVLLHHTTEDDVKRIYNELNP